MPNFQYQPFWCEENIWHLAADAQVGPGTRHVLIVTGTSGHVACWEQRAAAPGRVLAWDYHVVLAVCDGGWQVWDLDSRLGCPVEAVTWLSRTFSDRARVAQSFQPRFLLLTAAEYLGQFTTDRSHMRTNDGSWQKPPPNWSPPQAVNGVSLEEYRRSAQAGLSYEQLEAQFKT